MWIERKCIRIYKIGSKTMNKQYNILLVEQWLWFAWTSKQEPDGNKQYNNMKKY